MVAQKIPLTNIGICMPTGETLGARKNLKILKKISEFMDDFHTACGSSCTMNLSIVSQKEDVWIVSIHHIEFRRLETFFIPKLSLLGRIAKAFRQNYTEGGCFETKSVSCLSCVSTLTMDTVQLRIYLNVKYTIYVVTVKHNYLLCL